MRAALLPAGHVPWRLIQVNKHLVMADHKQQSMPSVEEDEEKGLRLLSIFVNYWSLSVGLTLPAHWREISSPLRRVIS